MANTSTFRRLVKNPITSFSVIFLLPLGLFAQSGDWDSFNTVGTTGYTDHGAGVIQLLDRTATGCAGAAVHETSATYDPTVDGVFSECYELYFGCLGDDEIGADTKGDGMAFSFSKCAYNIGNGNACGGGLGYMGSCASMITIEFDTWSSQAAGGFDIGYEGTGNDDQVAIHKDGDATSAGKIAGANPGNLEDGLEHTVCITYDPASDVMTVSIDGTDVLVHDLTGSGYELETYFGAGGLNQTWSSGKNGATNPATVSHGADITDNVGAPLCASDAFVTSPEGGDRFSQCDDPITITASAVPPSGNTVDSVAFYAGAVKIGSDNTEPFSIDWDSPTLGSISLTAEAYFSPSSTSTTSDGVSILVGGLIEATSTPPTIDGTEEALWSDYEAIDLDQTSGPTSPDLDATYKVSYDGTHLYLLVNVIDDDLQNDGGNVWENDGVELYIDIGNDKAGAYGADDYQYTFVYNDAPTVNESQHAATAGVSYAESVTAGGYIVEVSIPWTTLGGGAPSASDEIGFDVKINDDDGGGGRDHELAWEDGTFNQWNNTSLFGTQEFSDCNPVLPIELLSFNGHRNGDVVHLDWETVVEINNAGFDVEYSEDLNEWLKIGFVGGHGNSNVKLDYQFEDNNSHEGYYRLKQHDFDGEISYSPVIHIKRFSDYEFDIYPNPFTCSINIRNLEISEWHLKLLNQFGELVWEASTANVERRMEIRLQVDAGVYILELTSMEGTCIRERLVKL